MKLKEILFGIGPTLLQEVLDYENIKSYQFDKINEFEFKFKTDDNSEIYIQFEEFNESEILEYFRFPETFSHKLKSVFNTAFSVDGIETQAKITDLSYTLPIFKTITQINVEFISKKNPDCVTVFATSRTGDGIDAVKLRIWKLIATKHRPSGYNLDKCFKRIDSEAGFCLYKNELIKRKQ